MPFAAIRRHQVSDVDAAVKPEPGGTALSLVFPGQSQLPLQEAEPTHGVDVDGKDEIYDIPQELADQGKGVIFISSEFSELVGVCHRIIALRDGRIMGELEGDEINEEAVVELCYSDHGERVGG